MDQPTAKRILQELIKNEPLENKRCIDCNNPNPQWASLSFAVFLCLQCAGVHRGFGVHISFVRSVSMDTWQEDQIKRMQLGGNAPFKKFMKEYPAEGGWKQDMSPYDTYHSWAATQYREKLDAALAGKDWTPSAPPANAAGSTFSPPGRPSSAQGLRKSRASTRSGTERSASPFNPSRTGTPNPSNGSFQDQKTANEAYFATLGQANASRPDDLPPSQGGKYQGFGSTPAPSQHPSYGLSSAAVPTFSDIQENPMAALGKGWSLFSSAVAGASRVVSENIIQPGMEKVKDPNFQAGVMGYVNEAGKRAAEVGRTANSWTKNTVGVDVAEGVTGVVGTVKDRIGAGPERRGYGVVQQGPIGETSSLYQDDEDFFDSFESHSPAQSHPPSSAPQGTSQTAGKAAKKEEDWDEWKDF